MEQQSLDRVAVLYLIWEYVELKRRLTRRRRWKQVTRWTARFGGLSVLMAFWFVLSGLSANNWLYALSAVVGLIACACACWLAESLFAGLAGNTANDINQFEAKFTGVTATERDSE